MQPDVGLWTSVSAIALSAVAVLAARDAIQRGGRTRVLLTLALGLLAAVAVGVKANELTGFSQRWIATLTVMAFAGSGMALLEYRSAISPLRASVRLAAAAASAAAVTYALAVRFPLGPDARLNPAQWGAVGALVGVWCVCILTSAVRFWTAARDRPPVEGKRLRLLATSYGGMVAILAVVLTISAALGGRTTMVPMVQAAIVAFIPFLFVGVSPPMALQRLWLRRAARAQARALAQVGTWYWDVANDDVHWSTEVARMLEIERSGTPTLQWALDHIHPCDRDAASAMLTELLDARHPVTGEFRAVTGSGLVRWIEIRAQAVTDPATDEVVSLFGTVQDVTARKENELEVSESRRRLDEAQQMAGLGNWEADLATDTVTWSNELFRLHGLDPGGTPGPFPDWYLGFVHPDDRQTVEESIVALRWVREGFEIEYRIIVDDEIRWLRARGEPVVHPDGRLTALRGVCVDATDRHRSEEALKSAFERERKAVERLQALDDTKDAFLAAVSHELRTPLSVVLGLAQTLQRPELLGGSDPSQAILGRLEANALRLERLLVDLLDLDRLSRGVVEPKRRPVDVSEIAEVVVDTIDAHRHPILVEGSRVVASVDPSQLERIIENLVLNAVRHTPVGTRIVVGSELTDEGLLVTVDDDGPGVPDGLKEEIFSPFCRGDSPVEAGTGIGLSLVARFAELHGGRAWVEDAPAGGARFRVLLPTSDRGFEIRSADTGSDHEGDLVASRPHNPRSSDRASA